MRRQSRSGAILTETHDLVTTGAGPLSESTAELAALCGYRSATGRHAPQDRLRDGGGLRERLGYFHTLMEIKPDHAEPIECL
jgi:hypothetical protein